MVNSILDAEKHAPLLRNLKGFCQTAGVPERFIHTSMAGYCTEAEMDWVRHFHRNVVAGVAGMILVGVDNAEDHMMATAGALMRNYIDARVMTLVTVLERQEEGPLPEPDVLLIPNLCMDMGAKALPAWKVQNLYDLLVGRLIAGKPTIGCIDSIERVTAAYGKSFAKHLTNHYQLVN
jgi:hypothetical protein